MGDCTTSSCSISSTREGVSAALSWECAEEVVDEDTRRTVVGAVGIVADADVAVGLSFASSFSTGTGAAGVDGSTVTGGASVISSFSCSFVTFRREDALEVRLGPAALVAKTSVADSGGSSDLPDLPDLPDLVGDTGIAWVALPACKVDGEPDNKEESFDDDEGRFGDTVPSVGGNLGCGVVASAVSTSDFSAGDVDSCAVLGFSGESSEPIWLIRPTTSCENVMVNGLRGEMAGGLFSSAPSVLTCSESVGSEPLRDGTMVEFFSEDCLRGGVENPFSAVEVLDTEFWRRDDGVMVASVG